MTVVQARWETARISSHGRRPSLIAKYAAADRANAPIPLPAMVSIYQPHRNMETTDNSDMLLPAARQACLEIRSALSDGQRYVVVTGSGKQALSAVVEAAVGGLGFHKTYSTQASHVRPLLDEMAEQSDRTAPGLPAAPSILVVDNVDLLPHASVTALVELSDSPQHASMQMVLVGQSRMQDGSEREQYRALVNRQHVWVALNSEIAGKLGFDLEKDLARAWQRAGADKSAHTAAESGAVSPYPALAALLGQPLPRRSSRIRRWMIVLPVVVLVLCLIGSLSSLQHFQSPAWPAAMHLLR